MRQEADDPIQQKMTIDMRIASSWRAADVIAWKKSSFAVWSLRFMSQTARRAGRPRPVLYARSNRHTN